MASAIAAVLHNFGSVSIESLDEPRQVQRPVVIPNIGVFVIAYDAPLDKKALDALIKRLDARSYSHAFLIIVTDTTNTTNVLGLQPQPKQLFALVDSNQPKAQLIKEIRQHARVVKKEVKFIVRTYRAYRQEMAKQQQVLRFERDIKRAFKANYQDVDFKTSDLAELFAVSVSTLERRCVQLFDKTPKQLLMEYRVQKAREAIQNTKQPIKTIAIKTGFGSASYMSIRFQELFGCLPSALRAEKQRKMAV